ncbi:MAG: TonB-dependent receptor [Bacteroidaceae bacterium]|nr:TonB-dependent receptor [Bacteroidaceae bacterium]
MKKIIVLLVMLLAICSCWAMKPLDWSGRVTDGQNRPLAYVNVVFLSLPDSAFIQGTITSEDGTFLLHTEQKRGVIRASFLGYQTAWVKMPVSGELHITLPEESTMLEEIEVKGSLPKTKLQDGAMITQIQHSVLEKVGSADDVLSRIPGMMRMGDKLHVIGRGTPVYYINGRKVQNESELKRLQSQDIRQVEVISNPGAAYSAESAAVVRIRTVARQGEGWSGSADFSDAQTLVNGNNLFSGQLNLNWQKNNIDVFFGGNLTDNYLKKYESELDQQTFAAQSFRQKGTLFNYGKDVCAVGHAGFNWRLSENQSMGVRLERTETLKGEMNVDMDEDVFINGISQGRMLSARKDTDDGSGTFLANAYYNGHAGRVAIDWNMDYYHSDGRTLGNISEYQSVAPLSFKTTNQVKNHLFAHKLVLTGKVWKGVLTAGTEMSFVHRTNAYETGNERIENTFSKVREQNLAFFADYQLLIPNAGILTAGLRYEHIRFNYQPQSDEEVKRNQGHFFPSISFASRWGNLESIISYSFKTRRPTYRDLRSGLEYVNPFTFQTGDPTLKNENRQVLDLKMRWHNWAFQGGYERHTNGIYDWTYPYDDKGTVVISMVNFRNPINVWSGFLVYSPQKGCWTSSNVVGVQHGRLSFLLDDPREENGQREVKYNNPMYIFNSSNAFRLKRSWMLELNSEFWTKAHFANAQLLNNYWNLSVAVQKSWLKDDALTLRLVCSDLFQQSKLNVLLDLGNYTLTQTQINGQERALYEQHRIILSLKYRFNTTKSRYKGNGAAGGVIERM